MATQDGRRAAGSRPRTGWYQYDPANTVEYTGYDRRIAISPPSSANIAPANYYGTIQNGQYVTPGRSSSGGKGLNGGEVARACLYGADAALIIAPGGGPEGAMVGCAGSVLTAQICKSFGDNPVCGFLSDILSFY